MSSIPTHFGETFVVNVSKTTRQGNYTEDRHEWLDNLIAKEIYASILAKRQEKPK